MSLIKVRSSDLQAAYNRSADDYISFLVNEMMDNIGGKLNYEAMSKLNSDQITLLAYSILHEEVMDGGFVQLIYNGYGPFLFFNPFAKALANWGLEDLSKMIKKGGKLYGKHRKEIEHECSDEEFMAMFERFPDFDNLDDDFIENEEQWTNEIAFYINNNICHFVELEDE